MTTTELIAAHKGSAWYRVTHRGGQKTVLVKMQMGTVCWSNPLTGHLENVNNFVAATWEPASGPDTTPARGQMSMPGITPGSQWS